MNGFIWMAAEDGDGVSGMNLDAEAIDVEDGTDNNDNPSELQLEANRPPIIFLLLSASV